MTTTEKSRILRQAGWEDTGNGYWRRPPTGRKRIGRLFDSTNQAYNDLMREASEKLTFCPTNVEPIHLECSNCGRSTRETPHYWICNNCGQRHSRHNETSPSVDAKEKPMP